MPTDPFEIPGLPEPPKFYSEMWDNEPFPPPWLSTNSLVETMVSVMLLKLQEGGNPKVKVRGRVDLIQRTGDESLWMLLVTSESPVLSAQYTRTLLHSSDIAWVRTLKTLEESVRYVQQLLEPLLAAQLPAHQAYWHSGLWC